jgi:ankyrin repeat protein
MYQLAMSAYHDLSGILSALMNQNVEPEERLWSGDSAWCNILHVAAYRGHTDFIQKFQGLCKQEKFDLLLNKRDIRGATPLHYACDAKFQGTAGLLLRFGADPLNWIENSGESAYYCAVINHLTAIVKQICEMDPIAAKRRLLFKGVTTALHLAIQLGYTDMVQVLLEFKPDLRAQDGEGKTPLQLADSDVMKDLLLVAMDREHSELARQNRESTRQIEDLTDENDSLRRQLEALQSQMSS